MSHALYAPLTSSTPGIGKAEDIQNKRQGKGNDVCFYLQYVPPDCCHIAVEGEEDVMLEDAQQTIGTKTFALDDAFLDEYLERVLAWWHGEREPVGVEVELTRRCVYVQSFLLVVAKAFQADGCRLSGLASIVTGANGGRRRQRKRWRDTELAACLLRLWPLQERRRLGYSTRF